eukprot:1157775-Pelagomonas_calceolata.AAC.11
MSASMVSEIVRLPALRSFQLASGTVVARPCVLRKRHIQVEAELRIIRANNGTRDGSKFIEKLRISSNEFGTWLSFHVFSPDREEHESSSCLCAENGGVDSMLPGS